jgi:hypothetical protein
MKTEISRIENEKPVSISINDFSFTFGDEIENSNEVNMFGYSGNILPHIPGLSCQ